MHCTTLITGASSGIGRAVALSLAGPGRRLLIAARGIEGCERVVEEVRAGGGSAEAVALDVTDLDSIERAAERALAFDGRLELVHSAGSVAVHDVLESEVDGEDVYARLLEEHLFGAQRLVDALCPAMRERGGAVVSIASAAGLRAFPRTAAYVAAKHALVGYTRAAAAELEGTRVQVSAVCPYYVDSPMMDRGVAALAAERGITEDAARAEFGARNPGGRWIVLDEVARAIVDLLLPGANGRIVVLDGGPPRPPGPADVA